MENVETRIGYATKSQITQLFERACNIAEVFRKADGGRARASYADDHQRHLAREAARAKAEMEIQACIERAADAVKQNRERLERERAAQDKANANDVAQQLALSNAIKVLELRAAEMPDSELIELAAPFAGNIHARATLKAAAQAGKADGFRVDILLESVFKTVEKRDKAIKALERLERFIREDVWNNFRMSHSGAEVSAALYMILDKWDEALEQYQ